MARADGEPSGTIRPGPMELRLLPYSPERDVYRLLQIDPRSTSAEIIAACRRLSRTFHPDTNQSPRANEEMQVVNAVRGLLTDPLTRAEYDLARMRFLASQTYRGYRSVRVPERPMPDAASAGSSVLARNARAVWLGLLAAFTALAPARCGGCRSVIGRDDAFCLLCGRQLLITKAQN
jgi:curved DNA-binding protein CbpA